MAITEILGLRKSAIGLYKPIEKCVTVPEGRGSCLCPTTAKESVMNLRPLRTIVSTLAILTIAVTAGIFSTSSAGALSTPTVNVPGPSLRANASDILFGDTTSMACSRSNDRALMIADWSIAAPQNNRSTMMTITVKADPAPGTLIGRSQVVVIRTPLADQAHEQIALPCTNWNTAVVTWSATGLNGTTMKISETFRFSNIDSIIGAL